MKTTNIGASRILLLWSNIPALAAGKRAFRQLRWVFAYRNSGILPGEEMVYAGIATSVISTNIPPERQYLIFGKAKEQGRVNLDAPPQKQKRHPNGCRFKDFDALRQYFQTLRLTSELVDLRVGNANLIFGKAKEQGSRPLTRHKTKER